MADTNSKYSVLYNIQMNLYHKYYDESNVLHTKNISITSSDVLSIAIINDYDAAMYPIIRVRLYTDLSVMTAVTENADNLYVGINFNGAIYDMNDTSTTTPVPITSSKSASLTLKAYVENKNTPTSFADEYDKGLKKSDDLNVDRKVPITLYCYDEDMVHFMIQKVDSIYKEMDPTSVLETIFRKQGIVNVDIDPIQNQTKYDQILFPNLSITEAISFLDIKYGLYPKGAQIYGDRKMIIANSDSEIANDGYVIPIHVQSYKDPNDMGGLRKYISNNKAVYHFNTKAENVSVTTISDIERVLNSESIAAINVNTLDIETSKLTDLYDKLTKELSIRVNVSQNREKYITELLEKITTPDILHKSLSPFIASTYNARISERITRIDISGTGFDVFGINVRSRFNVIFDTPIRGLSINKRYRAMNMTTVFSNIDGDKFSTQTTMRLCNN